MNSDFTTKISTTKNSIITISDRPELIQQAARWFHQKWGVPAEAYLESMEASIGSSHKVPGWYLVLDERGLIIAGAGVIENDFHDRTDLAPNLCALYVEEDFRCQGIAGALLHFICRDMAQAGIDPLYLVTDHTSFYERYGWEFLCMAKESDGAAIRVYVHRQNPGHDSTDHDFMREAIRLSQLAVEHGNEPFGAVLVKDGKIVYTMENQIYSRHDPTFHAEAGLIREFCRETGITDLSEYTLYSSCEPCFMCCGAMVWTKLGRLVYGASDIELCSLLGVTGSPCSHIVFDACQTPIQVLGGVLRDEAMEVLASYFDCHKKG